MTSAKQTHHAGTSTDKPGKCPSSESAKHPVHKSQDLVIGQCTLQRTLNCLSEQSESGSPSMRMEPSMKAFKLQKGFIFRCASLWTEEYVGPQPDQALGLSKVCLLLDRTTFLEVNHDYFPFAVLVLVNQFVPL